MKIYLKLLFIILMLLPITLAGCSSKPTVTDLKVSEGYDGQQFGKILVIGAAEKITFRNLYEGEFVNQLRNKGIDAIPSHEILPYNNLLTKEIVLSAIENTGIDSVLITSLVERSKKEVLYFKDNNPYAYYNQFYREIQYPEKTASYDIEIFFLKTNLYDVRTEELIWSITIESEYKYNIKSLNPTISLVINKLRKDGLI